MRRTRQERTILSGILYRDLEQGFRYDFDGLVTPFRDSTKSFTLVKFAKDKGLPLLIGDKDMIETLRRCCDYNEIYWYKQKDLDMSKDYIIDNEKLDIVYLYKKGFKIVGGYK